MAHDVFTQVGLQPPMSGTLDPLQGGETFVRVTNTTNARVAGEIVAVIPVGMTNPPTAHEFKLATCQQAQNPGVAAGTLANGNRIFGVVMEDVTATGEALVMLRGVAYAWCQQVVTAVNRTAQPLLVAGLGITNASTTTLGDDEDVLANPFDLATTETAKIVGIYLDDTPLNAGAGEGARRMVLFNGVEGFGSWTKP